MSEVFNNTPETRGRKGAGSGIYTPHFQTDGLYALLAPFIKVPFIKKSVGDIEFKVASSDTITKGQGVTTLEAVEADIYLHRDSMILLEGLDGKTIPLLNMLGDFTGYKYDGTISYTPGDVEMDSAVQATVKITPVTNPEFVENCRPMLKPTAQFKTAITDVVELATTTGKFEQAIEMKQSGATFTATSDDVTVATVTATDNKLVITGVKEGSTIIRLVSALEGHASWKTTILVIVPKNGVAPANFNMPKTPTDK